MRLVYQSVTLSDQGYGDCFAACIASVLDLTLADVPHWYQDAGQEDRPLLPRELRAQAAWFKQRGLYYLEFGFYMSKADVLDGMATQNPGLHYLLTGVNLRRRTHTVVCRDDRIVHDPATDRMRSTLDGPCPDNAYRVGLIGKYV